MSASFNLNHAVATWRRFATQSSAISPTDADELESHLRDEIEELISDGVPPEKAFEQAIRHMGDYGMLDTAYRGVALKKRLHEHGILHELTSKAAMLNNYLKVAFRNLLRQKGYSFINVAGLSIGLACSFFILLWVMHELSFDRFHEHGDRIYRVLRNETNNGEVFTRASTPGPLGVVLTQNFPEIENATYTRQDQEYLVTYNGNSFREKGNHVSADFFEVFSLPLLQGDPATALQAENSAVISERLAERLFGQGWRNEEVIGKAITINREEDFTVTAIARNFPDNSTIQFDVLLPIHEFFAGRAWTQQWGNHSFPLYVRLKEGASLEDVNAKIADVIERHNPTEQEEVLFLYPFEDTYLYQEFENGINVGGRIDLIRIFAAVAVFLLIIASINFMNLATARSTLRSKEIGVRKAIGATQPSLTAQFMTETMLLAVIAFMFAMALVVGLLPAFNQITEKQIGILDLSPAFLTGMLGIALLTGLFAGSYPALYLSSFNPVAILRGTFRQKPGEARMRKGLVVFQFALSTLIIVCTAAVYLQIRYILEKDLGLDRGNLISINMDGGVQERYESFRQELMANPGIVNVTFCDPDPLSIDIFTSDITWDARDPNDQTEFAVLRAGYDFVETMQMELLAGRTHSRELSTDAAGYIINEAAAKVMGKADPVGERFALWDMEGQVIGVVKDFHMATFDAPISPTVIALDDEDIIRVWIRTEPGRTQEALASLEALYREFNPGYPFSYRFMDQEYEEIHRSVLVMGKLANVFAVMATFISCLGLFGLASFTAERRTKEIGIRKVMGASTSKLVILLSADFTKLVLLGFVLAAPLAYWLIQKFLGTFEYHVSIHPVLFILAGLAALIIAWLTVSYQSIKAALANPVKSLRYE
jgi:putative ABC transport system permease protein